MPEAEELVPEAELLPALSVKEDESPLRLPELPESIENRQHQYRKEKN